MLQRASREHLFPWITRADLMVLHLGLNSLEPKTASRGCWVNTGSFPGRWNQPVSHTCQVHVTAVQIPLNPEVDT